jgi:ankyrin repeat protein
MAAAQEGHKSVVALLLKNGADINAVDNVSYFDA